MESKIVKMEFMNTPVECIVKDGIKYLSIRSIGNAIGVESDTIRKIISRNKSSFGEYSVKDKLSGPDGKQYNQLCLSRDGILGLIFMLNTDLYSEDKQQTIIAFKKWTMKVLGEAYDNQFSNLITGNKEDQRHVTKIAHHAVMSAVTTTYTPQYEDGIVPRKKYMEENIMLNTVSFGHHKRGMRDEVEFEDLVRLSIAQGADLAMHERGVSDIYDRKNTIDNILIKHYIPAKQKQELLDGQLEQFM